MCETGDGNGAAARRRGGAAARARPMSHVSPFPPEALLPLSLSICRKRHTLYSALDRAARADAAAVVASSSPIVRPLMAPGVFASASTLNTLLAPSHSMSTSTCSPLPSFSVVDPSPSFASAITRDNRRIVRSPPILSVEQSAADRYFSGCPKAVENYNPCLLFGATFAPKELLFSPCTCRHVLRP